MALLPLVGRLHPMEYLGLLASILLLLLELLVRIITLALPPSVINFFYLSSRKLYDYLYMSPPSSHLDSRGKKKAFVRAIARASDFEELCELHGYACEEHVVQTKDGYLLGLHRLAWRKGEEGLKVNSGRPSLQKKVVFCMHGLLMNSEVWVCMAQKEHCLAFQLVDKGYDVWVSSNSSSLLILTQAAWKQQREQVFQEVSQIRSN
jgi:lysosomal acid lipase/cholesteryl ester hydrolase